MAVVNNLGSNTSDITLKKFVDMFMQDRVALSTVDSEVIKGVINPDTDSPVNIKRPYQFGAIRTSDGDIGSSTKSNLISGTAQARTQDYITVAVEYGQLQQAIQLNQLDRILAPAVTEALDTFESSLLTFMAGNAGLVSGTPGTAISTWAHVAETSAVMNAMGFKDSRSWYSIMNPFATVALADKQTALLNDGLVRSSWQNAIIPRNFGGTNAFMHNSLPTRTSGNEAGGTVAINGAAQESGYVAVKDTMTQTIALDGLTTTTGTIAAGDVLEFANFQWVNQQSKEAINDGSGAKLFTAKVTVGGTANGSGELTVTITPPIIIDATNPQYDNCVSLGTSDGSVVTVLGSASSAIQENLFYSKGFVGVGTVELPKLHSIDSRIINVDGFSIRMHEYSDGDANTQKVRWDILPAFAVLNPMLGGTFSG